MNTTNKIADSWNNDSDAYYARNASEDTIDRLIGDPSWAFPPEVWSMLGTALPEFHGKRVLVPSSGDNGAVFAFHLLGAKVTSADIAERQLYNAKKIADRHGWDIAFIQDDSMKLENIQSGAYDLVYTSNGVHVWIDDLISLYRSFYRVLKPGGKYIMFETHPFIRPFDDSTTEIKIVKPYEETGPFGEIPNYAWRVQDLTNAMICAGFIINRIEEFHSKIGSFDSWWYRTLAEAEADANKKFDWKLNPWAALPNWIGFSARKD